MTWGFKAGDRVRCVDDAWLFGEETWGYALPVAGREYTIREVGVVVGKPCLRLVELENPSAEWLDGFNEISFRSCRFRPIRTTDISALQAHLQTIPARKPVRA